MRSFEELTLDGAIKHFKDIKTDFMVNTTSTNQVALQKSLVLLIFKAAKSTPEKSKKKEIADLLVESALELKDSSVLGFSEHAGKLNPIVAALYVSWRSQDTNQDILENDQLAGVLLKIDKNLNPQQNGDVADYLDQLAGDIKQYKPKRPPPPKTSHPNRVPPPLPLAAAALTTHHQSNTSFGIDPLQALRLREDFIPIDPDLKGVASLLGSHELWQSLGSTVPETPAIKSCFLQFSTHAGMTAQNKELVQFQLVEHLQKAGLSNDSVKVVAEQWLQKSDILPGIEDPTDPAISRNSYGQLTNVSGSNMAEKAGQWMNTLLNNNYKVPLYFQSSSPEDALSGLEAIKKALESDGSRAIRINISGPALDDPKVQNLKTQIEAIQEKHCSFDAGGPRLSSRRLQ